MRLLHRTARAAFVGLSAIVLATACSGEPTGAVELTGTYQLTAINGGPLPFVVSETAEETAEIVEGWIELDPSGRFSDVTVYRISGPDVPAQEDVEEFTGDYELSGGQIIFHEDQGREWSMARDGATLTQTITSGSVTDTFKYSK